MKTRILPSVVVCLAFGAVSSFAAPGGEGLHSVHWDFPRLGNCHEGMAFADGVTGVLVWGGGDELRLTVGRD